MKYILVTTALGFKGDADMLAQAIMEKKLGTCCQIDKVESSYLSKGKIENKGAGEVRMSIVTKASLYKELETLIINDNVNEIPEIIAVPIIDGSAQYLNCIESELK